jgi:serine protease Do
MVARFGNFIDGDAHRMKKLMIAIPLLAIGGLPSPQARAGTARRRDAIVEVVQKVSPAVVYIGAEHIIEPRYRGSFFDEFFGIPSERRRQSVQSLGSGVIIDPAGIIVTNDHVIHTAAAIHVVLADGRQLEADVVGSDAENDVAVLRIQSKTPFPSAKLGTSSDLMIGEAAIAIGSPFGLRKTVTTGVVSAVGRSFKADGRVYNDFIQTDASINPGNSGGPLLNIDGEVIGINTAIYASGQGIGFAIPADKVRRIVAELTQFGKVRPAWIGIRPQDLTASIAQSLSWDRNYGVAVADVESTSPAEQAGIKVGDIIAEVGGTRVEDSEDFNAQMRGYPARTAVNLAVFRDGSMRSISINTAPFPPKLAETLAWERLGIRVKEGQGGLAISAVRPGSSAARIGISSGDMILKLNNQPMSSMDVFKDAMAGALGARSVLLVVRHGRFNYNLSLPF